MIILKKTIVSLSCIVITNIAVAQMPQAYFDLAKKADSLYKIKEYKNSAFTYSLAFKANGWKGTADDRYNAACSWALANYPDSAFFQLNRIATRINYSDYDHTVADHDLISLHKDNRWVPLLEIIKGNKEKAEAKLNKPLIAELDSIYKEDQNDRMQTDDIGKKYGWTSKEIKARWKIINQKDSINLIKVKTILDTYGWLGPDVIGGQGNSTLFLVIQHSNQKAQEQYLPMMREAAKNGKAFGGDLALLEDRVALGQGKKQIYGSQIKQDSLGNYSLFPLEDPDHVDERRASVGLQPLADYLSHWKLKWDVEQYKKVLLTTESKEKK